MMMMMMGVSLSVGLSLSLSFTNSHIESRVLILYEAVCISFTKT